MLISHITVGRWRGSKQANVGQGLSFSKVIMVGYFYACHKQQCWTQQIILPYELLKKKRS